jgi:mono/diheme cytochrome c family protein
MPAQPKWENRLGWSHVDNGEVQPFAGIDCDSILGFIYPRLIAVNPQERDALLARAIGRVLAHEFDHIFAETTEHGHREMDQPDYTVDELLAPSLSTGMVQTHILRPANNAPAKPPAGSAATGASTFAQSGCATCHGAHGEGSSHGPVLSTAGHLLNGVMLATRVARSEQKMCKRAVALKLPPPSLDEAEIQDVVSYLNHIDQ